MLTREQLVALLNGADTAWTTAQGVTRQWRRQRLVTIAFEWHVDALEAAGRSIARITATRDDGDDDDPIIESVLRVAADSQGRRRRVEAVSRRGEEWQADTVVIDGDTFWARTGTSVATNGGDPNHSHGGADIVALLLPSAVPAGFDVAPTDEQDLIADRPCAVGTASPREPDPYGHIPGSEVFNMIAGGTDFRLSIDLETGILLRVIKFVDNELAELCEFTEITINEPLDDALFAPVL